MSRFTCSVFLIAAGCAEPIIDDVLDDTPSEERHRVFYLRNGTLGKIMDSADTRTGVETADADCTTAAADRMVRGLQAA